MSSTQDTLTTWRTQNDAGNGFAAGAEGDSPAAAAVREGWQVVETTGEGNAVCTTQDGRKVMVCDANGAWACYVDGE